MLGGLPLLSRFIGLEGFRSGRDQALDVRIRVSSGSAGGLVWFSKQNHFFREKKKLNSWKMLKKNKNIFLKNVGSKFLGEMLENNFLKRSCSNFLEIC